MKKAIILLTAALIGLGCAGNRKLIEIATEPPESIVIRGDVRNNVTTLWDILKRHGRIYSCGGDGDCNNDGRKEYMWVKAGDGIIYYTMEFNEIIGTVWHRYKPKE